jgi:acyl-CoA dehydrogenase
MTALPRTVFSDEHEMFRDAFRKFLVQEAVPFQDQWEKDGVVSREIWRKAGEQGYLSVNVPERFGGLGLDFAYNAVMTEEIIRHGLSGLAISIHTDIVLPYLCDYGSDALIEKYMPRLLTGEMITAIAMTEPGAGSDLKSIRTSAVRDGDHYVLNGSKTYITNGQLCDLVLVVAKTDPAAGDKGISLFAVETESPGFQRGKRLEKLGMKAQDTSELFFDNLRVPAENLLGEENKGFRYLMRNLSQERLTCSLAAVASAEVAIEETIKFVKERIVFGQPLATFQNTQFKLAEMSAQAAQGRVFVDKCLELFIAGKLDGVTAAQVKLVTTEMAGRVVDDGLQLHGGAGYMWEYPICRLYADSRVQRIFAGSNEVMKVIIGRGLLA